jgi:superoxide dismutase, Fe-Mn family
MRQYRQLIVEAKKIRPADVEIIPLNFEPKQVKAVMSKDTLDLHYEKLAKGYAKRYNEKEGDPEFNYAGAFLHNTYFPQFRETRENNKPNGPIANFIDQHFGSFEKFQTAVETTAMQIQGSGWVYLSQVGTIKTIPNHEVRNDILLLIDWWEHAFILDYGSDKKKYLKETWKIINWNVISTRWGKSISKL